MVHTCPRGGNGVVCASPTRAVLVAVAATAASAALLLAAAAATPPLAGDAAAQLAPPEGAPPGQCCAAGSADGQFSSPVGVDLNTASGWQGGNRILVADTGNHRIQVFQQNGTFAFKFGSHGDGEFDSPKDIEQGVRSSNRDLIAVADTGNHRIQVFHADRTPYFELGMPAPAPAPQPAQAASDVARALMCAAP